MFKIKSKKIKITKEINTFLCEIHSKFYNLQSIVLDYSKFVCFFPPEIILLNSKKYIDILGEIKKPIKYLHQTKISLQPYDFEVRTLIV